MSTIEEIESAIAQLPTPQVERLAVWLEKHRAERDVKGTKIAVEDRLSWARGAAKPGVTTDQIMQLTRGED